LSELGAASCEDLKGVGLGGGGEVWVWDMMGMRVDSNFCLFLVRACFLGIFGLGPIIFIAIISFFMCMMMMCSQRYQAISSELR
jgi:hypothetical protein